LSEAHWNSAGNCGACVSVTGPNGNSIKAMVRIPRLFASKQHLTTSS
jgi:hypothetical protein